MNRLSLLGVVLGLVFGVNHIWAEDTQSDENAAQAQASAQAETADDKPAKKSSTESPSAAQSEAVLDEDGVGGESWKRKPISDIGASRESRGQAHGRQKGAVADISVVVTAARGMEQDPLDVPQSISTITSEEIESSVYTDVSHILRDLPNVGLAQATQPYSTRQGGSTSSNYWNEGFTIRGLGNQRVLVMTDGVRQAGQGIGYGGGNLSLYDVYSIEDIEVIRGPGSVLYGTDAIGGVVNVTTRNPKKRETAGYNGSVRYAVDGSRNLNRVGGYADVGDKDWGLVIGGSYTDAGDPNLPRDYFPDGGRFVRAGGWMKFDYYLSDKSRIRFLANDTKNTHVAITDTTATNLNLPIDMNIPLYERTEVGVELLVEDVSDRIEEVKAGLFWQGIRRKMDNITPLHTRVGAGMPPIFSIHSDRVQTNDKTNTFEFQPKVRLDFEPHTLTVGADFGYDQAKLIDATTDTLSFYAVGTSSTTFARLPFDPVPPPSGTVTGPTTSTIADAEQYRVGLYAQDNWDLAPFEVVLGGRLDYFNVSDEIAPNTHKEEFGVSGSIGLVYHYTPETMYYCNLASGFRAPDLGERFQSRTMFFFVPTTVIGNPNLDPERSYTAEIGTKARHGWFRYELAGFVNQIENYIGQKKISSTGMSATWQYQNIGDVLLYGAEGLVAVYPVEDWEIFGNAGHTGCANQNKLAVPNWSFNYGTNYTIYSGTKYIEYIKPGVTGRTVLKSYDSLNDIRFGGFTTFDAQVNFGIKTSTRVDATFIIGLKNIFDRAYREPFFTGYSPGRGVFAALQVDF